MYALNKNERTMYALKIEKADQKYARLLDLVRNRRAAILEEVENCV